MATTNQSRINYSSSKEKKLLSAEKVKTGVFFLLLSFLGLLFAPYSPAGQLNQKLNVFLDCPEYPAEIVQKEIPFLTLSRAAEEAEVLVRVRARQKSAEIIEYTIEFIGQQKFQGDDDRLQLEIKAATPEEARQKQLAHAIKMGLMRYLGKTPLARYVAIRLEEEVKPTAVEDKWNFWVFNLSVNSFLNGEKSYRSGLFFGGFSANRVTEELKIRASLGAVYQDNLFKFGGRKITSTSESQSFQGLIVKSISEHVSVGGYLSLLSSSFSNIQLSFTPAPAVEFNIFPYSESTRRQLRLLYRLGFTQVAYREETIYGKTRESLWQESLTATLELKRKWGTISTSLEGSHYFHDFQKNRLQFSSELSIRIFKGLSFNISGSYSRIRDQLSLPRGGASLEEILLRRKELETTYNYYLSVGISYTFGSTKSRVVNPRFGTESHGFGIKIGL